MSKMKKKMVEMMYCEECKEVLIEFHSWEQETYTAIYRTGVDGLEFVDRSDGESDYKTDYHCPQCDGKPTSYEVELKVAKVLLDYAEEKALEHFPFKHPEGLDLDEITATEAKKILLQSALEETE